MSVSDLRARLKRATNVEPTVPMLPLRTCLDILLKLKPHLSTQFWFTLDGKEIVTESVLRSEIIAFLTRENFRARIDEIAKELNIDVSVIASECAKIDSINIVLADAILTSPFWESQVEVAKKETEKNGILSISQMAEKLNLPIDLVRANIVPHLRIDTQGHFVSPFYSSIITARVTGVINGLSEPRTIDWIADFVSSDVDTVREILMKLTNSVSFGELGKDGIYCPKIWIQAEAAEADRSLTMGKWCTVSGLKALTILHGREFVDSKWKSEKNIHLSTVIIQLHQTTITDILNICHTDINTRGWCDMQQVFISIFPNVPTLSHSEYGSVCDLIFEKSLENFSRLSKTIFVDEETVLSTIMEKLADNVTSMATSTGEKSPVDLDDQIDNRLIGKCEKILKSHFGFSDPDVINELIVSIRIRLREKLKNEIAHQFETRMRPNISLKLSSDSEEFITELFFEFINAVEGMSMFGSPEILIPQFNTNVIDPLVKSVFAFALSRFNLPSHETDRLKIIKSVPSVLEPVKDALKFFDRLSVHSDVEQARNHLRAIGIVISEKLVKQRTKRNKRKIRSEFLSLSNPNLGCVAEMIVFEITNCRFSWVSNLAKSEWVHLMSTCSVSDPQLIQVVNMFTTSDSLNEVVQLLTGIFCDTSP